MLQSCTQTYTDESDERAFRFTFYCDCCGAAFHSAPIPFSQGPPPQDPVGRELWVLRWKEAHKDAFGRSDQEAMLRHFCCPGCGKYICPDCIVSGHTPEGEPRDRCPDCAARSRRMRPFRAVSDPPVRVEDAHAPGEGLSATADRAVRG